MKKPAALFYEVDQASTLTNNITKFFDVESRIFLA